MKTLTATICVLAFCHAASTAEKLKPLPANPNLKPVMVEGLSWSGDLASALSEAAKEKKLVFIDFTGVTCTNCKINEKNVFTKAEVKDLFKKYVRVQLYTDTVPEGFYSKAAEDEQREKDATANQEFQKKSFKAEQLPLYVILKPAGDGTFETIGVYDEGKINKVDKFVEFLSKPLKE
jgi:thiol:disulfide interchange protein DsbD